MTNELETETKKQKSGGGKGETKPVKSFRDGGISAMIWKRESSTGFPYYEYSISRSWKASTGKTGYSSNYFAKNQAQLLNVIQQASTWIAENEAQLVQAESLAA
ncbi:hypothetical protein [Lacipirellula sp.]|uniref:hypothetical protein n=1 Tax=Lacipirellula sp. TaxID=2691419 RepID=UPI003D12DEB4